MTTISIVTPWLDHLELADDYFAAVDPVDAEVLVIDNGSTPPLAFATIRLEHNLGFVGGCNCGLEKASGDAVLFLNNDIVATDHDWLTPIRNAVEPGVLVGAQLRHDRHGDVDGYHLPYLDGWCLAGMRDDLLELGGFDDVLVEPAYYSDNLLCLEARAAGMRLREVRVGLRHLENTTAGPYHDPCVAHASKVNRGHYVARARELLVPA